MPTPNITPEVLEALRAAGYEVKAPTPVVQLMPFPIKSDITPYPGSLLNFIYIPTYNEVELQDHPNSASVIQCRLPSAMTKLALENATTFFHKWTLRAMQIQPDAHDPELQFYTPYNMAGGSWIPHAQPRRNSIQSASIGWKLNAKNCELLCLEMNDAR
jgi:hypothetical protein